MIGNWFCAPIIFKNPLKSDFSIRNFLLQFGTLQILLSICLLFSRFCSSLLVFGTDEFVKYPTKEQDDYRSEKVIMIEIFKRTLNRKQFKINFDVNIFYP